MGVTVTVKGPDPHATLVFSSIAEFERWRHGAVYAPATIASYVQEALSLLGGTRGAIEPALDWLSRRHSTPTVKEFCASWSSRRSFFRAWKQGMHVSPREFLNLVRCLHAEDLLRHGMADREVARKLGFRTATAMHQVIKECRDRSHPS
jgi:transcriptional regulator GlxA family with amidase domain